MLNFRQSKRNNLQQLNSDGPGVRQPVAKLMETGRQLSKNWTFERLEDRQMMAVNLNDPYFEFQWPLLNTGGPNIGDQLLQDIRGVVGEDINVIPAWSQGLTGDGVRVAIVSTGIQTNHPDLAANISPTLQYNAINGSELPNAGEATLGFAEEAIGTALAGIVGAVGNNGEGIVGVAYESELVPVKLLNSLDGLNSDSIDPNDLRDLFLWENDQIDIYLHGWGPDDSLSQLDGPSLAEIEALRLSTELGRNGLGNIHIFPAGDGAREGTGDSDGNNNNLANDFAGYNGYVNSRYTIAVSSVDHDGEAANVDGTLTRYAEAGPAVLVAAPSGSYYGFGIVDDEGVGSGVWTTDFFPNQESPLSIFNEGFNAPTLPDGSEENDLLVDPLNGLSLNDRFFDPAYTSRGATGTEVAAAHVAGVVALMLEAEPNLSYRDVQEILVRSSRQNAQFETLELGFDQTTRGEFPETWITNRNEIWHDPDFWNAITVDDFTTVDNVDLQTNIGIFNNPAPGATGGALAHIYHPRIDPSDPFNNFGGPEWSPVSLYTNGAGYTVSQGRTFQGTELGYGHGVVDAGLAVELASQWFARNQNLAAEETFTTEAILANWNLPAVEIGNQQDIGTVIIPGRPLGDAGFVEFFNEYGQDDPFVPGPGPVFEQGFTIPLDVPFENELSLEWVEAQITLSSGDIDNVRITLISPNGVHSELNHYFDSQNQPEFFQYSQDPTVPGGSVDDLAGPGPGAPGDADGGDIFHNFSTNRHWGERTGEVLAIDPATGEPYESGVPTTRGWNLLLENYGAEALVLNTFEVSFHGTPVEANTQRIQGFVGVDENQDTTFNFDRYIQTYQDLFPRESLQEDAALRLQETALGLDPLSLGSGVDFTRLGEVERFADESQEQFAENVTVELWARTAADIAAGTDGAKIDEFITGDDGNYYFDVNPLVEFSSDPDAFNIDVGFFGGLTDSQKEVFDLAAARWEEIIVGDLPDVEGVLGTLIDDVLITASGLEIDGVGGILGQAGPRQFRDDGTFLPAAGLMEFDIEDLAALEASGELFDVILHEMGHVLGIGTIWEQRALIGGSGTPNPVFLGQEAIAQYNAVFGTNATGVPIEPDVEAHWDEAVFGNELMTPFIDGPGLPISSITVGMLQDLGYSVDLSAADFFDPFAPSALATGPTGSGIDTSGQMLRPEIETTLATTLGTGAAAAALSTGPDQFVEYVVRVADGEGRGFAKDDPNVIDGFLPKYKREWTITSDYFSAWEHDRAPDYERDSAGNIIPNAGDEVELFDVSDPENPLSLGIFLPSANNLIGGTTFNPATDYDIPVDANGDPIPYQNDFLGPLRDNVRGINFLLDPAPAVTDPELITVNVSGTVFADNDASGGFSEGDVALTNVTVYIDENFDGSFTPGEPTQMTSDVLGSEGAYSFDFQATSPRAIRVGVVAPTGFELGNPSSGILGAIITTGDPDITDFNFSMLPINGGGGTGPGGGGPGGGGPGGGGPGGSTAPGRVQGVVFEDVNADGIRQSTEFGLPNTVVYVDLNGNFTRDVDEPSALTNQFGVYDLSDIDPGDISIRVEAELPFSQVSPGGTGSIFIELLPDGLTTGVNFGVRNLATRDFGDLAAFPTFEADGGAWHEIKPGLFLGLNIDGEIDGQPNVLGLGDDIDGGPNDDDGVTLIDASGDGLISPGEVINFQFLVNGVGQSINAWIDFNGDGDWNDAGEHVFVDASVVDGINTTGGANVELPTIVAPANTATDKAIAARFRLGGAGLTAFGGADSGEVEDYLYNTANDASLVSVAGDFDLDGSVNVGDYQMWKANYGATGPHHADADGDGKVGLGDFTIWRDNMGAKLGISSTYLPGSGAGALLLPPDDGDGQAPASIATPLATFDLDSALATAGLQQEPANDGSGATLITATGPDLLPGAAEMLDAIGATVTPTGGSESAALAEQEANELQLAFELAGADAEEEDAVLTPLNEADAEEEEEALAVALEEGLLDY
ncbi:MAG: S8 family serine peptidase [Planctomycetota bacterium]